MSVRPPLPPRKAPPPPPPRPPARSNTLHNESTQEQRLGLGAVIRNATLAVAVSHTPPLPARRQTIQQDKPTADIDLQRLLARRPPPPPRRDSAPVSSEPPRRRLPPPPARLPTPPPVNTASKPQLTSDSEPVDGLDQEPCLICHDFSVVDNHASMFPRHSVSSLPSLAYDLTEPFTSETEKARAIFTWLHHNIAYDTGAFFSGNLRAATPESTLSSGLAVCDGYAGLYKYLLECVGIQAQKVSGHGKGFGYQALPEGSPVPTFDMNHAWNCVFMDGVWRLVDPCWGAGAVCGTSYTAHLTPKWFNSSPVEFGKSHFPEDPSYQLLDTPITWEEYILEEEKPLVYGPFYDFNFSQLHLEPSTARIEGGRYVDFAVQKRCPHLSTAEADNYVYILVIGDTRVPLKVSEGRWYARAFIPSQGEVTLGWVRTVNEQDAKGLSVLEYQNSQNGIFRRMTMSFGGIAKWVVE